MARRSHASSGIQGQVAAFEARVDRRFEAMDRRFDSIDRRFDGMQTQIAAFESRVDSRLQQHDRRFEGLDSRFDSLEHKLSRQFHWVVGLVVTVLAAALSGVLAR